MNQDLSASRTRTTKIPTQMFLKRKKEKKRKKKTNPNLNTRTTFSFLVFHPLLFIKTHTIPSSLSLFSSLPYPLKSTPQANTRKKKATNLRLIPFGFDSFKYEVASGLVLAPRFGFEVSVWFL